MEINTDILHSKGTPDYRSKGYRSWMLGDNLDLACSLSTGKPSWYLSTYILGENIYLEMPKREAQRLLRALVTSKPHEMRIRLLARSNKSALDKAKDKKQ